MKYLLIFLLFPLFGSAADHIFIGTGATSLRLAQPGYEDSLKYPTYFATEYAIAPGDRIIIEGGFLEIHLYGYRGTAAQKITLTYQNDGADVKYGFKMYDVSDFHVIGNPTSYTSADTTGARFYGIRTGDATLATRNAGFDVLGRIKNITIKNVKTLDGTYSVRLKTDPPEVAFYGFCDSSYVHFPWRANNNIIDSILLEGIYSQNMLGDPLYIGNTNPFSLVNGSPTYYTCGPGGANKEFTPMRMGNVVIRYCYINIAGRTGIQLSGAEYGKNEIYGNYISNVGDELNQDQGTGIAIGGATKNCRVHDNRIKKTFKYAIFDIGFGTNYIYNNWMDSIGFIERYIESGAYNSIFPYRDRDSTITTETTVFAVSGDKVANIHLGQMVTIVSKPAAKAGYVKYFWIFDNIFGLNSGVMNNGAMAFRQDDGLNENWGDGKDNYYSGNTNRIGETPHVWTYAEGPDYLTSTPPEIPEEEIPVIYKIRNSRKLKF